jgi:hypothetical protein
MNERGVAARSVFTVAVVVTALLVAALAQSALAGGNIVPNPGFEAGPCVGPPISPIICRWAELTGTMTQDFTDPHTGLASMNLTGTDMTNVEATTTNGFCIKMSEGAHTASFWYRTGDMQANQEAFSASFYPNSTCSVGTFGFDIVRTFAPSPDGAWHQVTGTITAPAGTGSGFFGLLEGCNNPCSLNVNFDDLDVEDPVFAVTLSSFRAVRSRGRVLLRWRTGSEVDTLGFNVFRQQSGKRVRLNRRLLPALGAVAGSSYSFVDRRAPRRAVRYWLQDVSTHGVRTWHGPVRAPAA